MLVSKYSQLHLLPITTRVLFIYPLHLLLHLRVTPMEIAQLQARVEFSGYLAHLSPINPQLSIQMPPLMVVCFLVQVQHAKPPLPNLLSQIMLLPGVVSSSWNNMPISNSFSAPSLVTRVTPKQVSFTQALSHISI